MPSSTSTLDRASVNAVKWTWDAITRFVALTQVGVAQEALKLAMRARDNGRAVLEVGHKVARTRHLALAERAAVGVVAAVALGVREGRVRGGVARDERERQAGHGERRLDHLRSDNLVTRALWRAGAVAISVVKQKRIGSSECRRQKRGN